MSPARAETLETHVAANSPRSPNLSKFTPQPPFIVLDGVRQLTISGAMSELGVTTLDAMAYPLYGSKYRPHRVISIIDSEVVFEQVTKQTSNFSIRSVFALSSSPPVLIYPCLSNRSSS